MIHHGDMQSEACGPGLLHLSKLDTQFDSKMQNYPTKG